MWQVRYAAGNLKTIDDLYTMNDITNAVKDGDMPYPPVSKEKEAGYESVEKVKKGAKLEFK